MYTHIGDGVIVNDKNIIGIFDSKTIQSSRENKKIILDIKKIEEKDNISDNKKAIKDFKCKSIILLKSDNENKYETSLIAVTTLKKRLEKNN